MLQPIGTTRSRRRLYYLIVCGLGAVVALALAFSGCGSGSSGSTTILGVSSTASTATGGSSTSETAGLSTGTIVVK